VRRQPSRCPRLPGSAIREIMATTSSFHLGSDESSTWMFVGTPCGSTSKESRTEAFSSGPSSGRYFAWSRTGRLAPGGAVNDTRARCHWPGSWCGPASSRKFDLDGGLDGYRLSVLRSRGETPVADRQDGFLISAQSQRREDAHVARVRLRQSPRKAPPCPVAAPSAPLPSTQAAACAPGPAV
jgi:hypothetical protein